MFVPGGLNGFSEEMRDVWSMGGVRLAKKQPENETNKMGGGQGWSITGA